MIQEYLFSTEEYKKDLMALEIEDNIQKEITTIDNSSCWTLCLSTPGQNEIAAKLLDNLNTQICEKYSPVVLSDECSAYFNKSLFPIINEFERKLRKLLYLASTLQESETNQNVISNLESKDLGEIFAILFSDDEFVKNVRTAINKKTWQFTREELLTSIGKLDENTLWDKLLGGECVKTLCENFVKIKAYRNDVMHAHNINLSQYKEARTLLNKVNKELDIAIGELIGDKEENEGRTFADFNKALVLELMLMRSQYDTNSLFDTGILSSDFKKFVSELGETIKGKYEITSDYKETVTNLSKIAAILQSNILSETSTLRSIIKQIINYNIETQSEIAELQNKPSEKNLQTSLEDNTLDKSDEKDSENT